MVKGATAKQVESGLGSHPIGPHPRRQSFFPYLRKDQPDLPQHQGERSLPSGFSTTSKPKNMTWSGKSFQLNTSYR